MKLNELYKPKISNKIDEPIESYINDTYDTDYEYLKFPMKVLSKKLKSLGWRLIGQGAFSNVYANPKKNYVMKVNTSSDDAFAHYVDVIKKHKK